MSNLATQTPRRGAPATRPAVQPPFFPAVFDAATFVDATDGDFTMIDIAGEARNMNVLPGAMLLVREIVPPIPSVLSKDDAQFHIGSGRRELSDKIFSDGRRRLA